MQSCASFGVSSVEAWETTYGERLLSTAAYRHSPSFKSNRYALATWLRLGQIEADGIATQPFNKTSFINALVEIRRLTSDRSNKSLDTTKRLCAEAGVALTIVKPLPRTSLHASTRWLSPQKALIQLTARHLRDDQLWFSLFHEAAHILLHGKRLLFVRSKQMRNTKQEEEADRWASDFLIPRGAWGAFSDARFFGAGDVIAFADEQGIAPGIVVGRLQYEKRIHWSSLNHLKTKLEWKG